MAREGSFQAGFGGALGVLLAVSVVFIGLPLLMCFGCFTAVKPAIDAQAEAMRREREERQAAEAQTNAEESETAPVTITTQPQPSGPEIPEGNYPVRTWRDSNGRNATQAKLITAHGGEVTLLLGEGRKLTMPVKGLSGLDIRYLERLSERQAARLP